MTQDPQNVLHATVADTPPERNWQVVEITGVGIGEAWFDQIRYGLTKSQAQDKAKKRDDWVAIRMAGDADE